MNNSFENKKNAALYVDGIIQNLKPGSALTTTIIQEKSGACSVNFVIDELLDDTEMQKYSEELTSIYQEEQDG